MDQTVHLFPWQTPSEGNGRGGNRGVSDGFGRAEASSRLDAEPGAQCAGFPVQGGLAHRIGGVFRGAESAGSLSGGAADQSSVASEKGSLDQPEQTEAEKLGERFHRLVESRGR